MCDWLHSDMMPANLHLPLLLDCHAERFQLQKKLGLQEVGWTAVVTSTAKCADLQGRRGVRRRHIRELLNQSPRRRKLLLQHTSCRFTAVNSLAMTVVMMTSLLVN